MDKEFEEQFLEELTREKIRSKRTSNEVRETTKLRRVSRSQLARESTYGDSVIKFLYKFQHKKGLSHVTYNRIASGVNPLVRPILNFLLTNLEDEHYVDSFEVRQKRVYRLNRDLARRWDAQIQELQENRLSRLLTGPLECESEIESKSDDVNMPSSVPIISFEEDTLDDSTQEEATLVLEEGIPKEDADIFNSPQDYVKVRPKI